MDSTIYTKLPDETFSNVLSYLSYEDEDTLRNIFEEKQKEKEKEKRRMGKRKRKSIRKNNYSKKYYSTLF